MSKRCKIQSEYYKEYGDYKARASVNRGKDATYCDSYVKWLEDELIKLREDHIKQEESN